MGWVSVPFLGTAEMNGSLMGQLTEALAEQLGMCCAYIV